MTDCAGNTNKGRFLGLSIWPARLVLWHDARGGNTKSDSPQTQTRSVPGPAVTSACQRRVPLSRSQLQLDMITQGPFLLSAVRLGQLR